MSHHRHSARRFISLSLAGLIVATMLSACGGTVSETSNWWYNQSYIPTAE